MEMKNNTQTLKQINDKISSQKYREAESLLKDYIQKYPKDENAYIMLSDIYEIYDEYDKSEEIIKKGIKETEKNARLFDRLATNFLYTKKIEEAKKILLCLVKNEEASAMTYGNLGIISILDGENREAIDYYKKSLEIDKNNVTTIINLAMAYSDLYIYDEALRIFKDALEIEKSDVIREHIRKTENKLAASKFEIGELVKLPVTPDIFNVLVPENFNSSIEKGVIKIQSEDKRVAILITCEEKSSTEDDIKAAFMNYENTFRNIDRLVAPFFICERPRFEDKFALMIFTEMPDENGIGNFHALSLAKKENKTIFLTLSARVQITDKFLNIARTIIESISLNGSFGVASKNSSNMNTKDSTE